jgi:hypothetical protein
MSGINKDEDIIKVSSKERNLINYIRELGFGRLYVIVHQNQPVRVEQAIKGQEL